jgi:hypothetical protein
MSTPPRSVAVEAVAWAKLQPLRRVRCTVCLLPDAIRAGIDAQHRAGVQHRIKAAWLASKGFVLDDTTIGRHYNRGHHEHKG